MKNRETVAEACARLIPDGISFDFALPQDWYDDFSATVGIFPSGLFVWIYDRPGGLFGRPYPLHPEYAELLKTYNQKAGCNYPATMEINPSR